MTRRSFPPRPCETYGRNHGGICYKAIGACYNYSGIGQFTKDCASACRSRLPTTIVEGSVQSSAPEVHNQLVEVKTEAEVGPVP